MAYIDAYTGMDVLTAQEEEERRRKAAEEAAKKAGTTVVGETKIKEYEDGSQTEIITKEIPSPGPIAPEQPGMGSRIGTALQQAGTNFMTNLQAAPDNFVQNVANIPGQIQKNISAVNPATQAMLASAPAPAPDTGYNARIAQLESGANPNIGYHDRAKGTAFGTYGLTDAAYQDARRANPALPADKTQATPEQQTAAMNAYTSGNARQLQQFGIEPTPGNLATSHLLGATGLKRFQESGYLSPQAIAANGGEEKLRQIIAQRQAGTGGAASGAVPAPAAPASGFQGQTNEFGGMEEPAQQNRYSLGTGQTGMGLQAPGGMGPMAQAMGGMPAPGAAPAPVQDQTQAAIGRYQAIQNDPNELMKFAFDDTTPDYLKQRAKDQIVEQYDQQKKQAEAEKVLATMNQNDVARAIAKKSQGNSIGDWAQYLLLKHVGLNDLANQKGEQLGIGHKWNQTYITDDTGREIPVEVQTSAGGRVLRGNIAGTDTALTPAQLTQAAGMVINGANLKTLQTQANQSASSAMDAMRKENQAAQNRGLAAPYSEEQVLQRGRDVYRQTLSVTRPAMPGAKPTATATGPTATTAATTTPGAKTGVLENWNQKRVGEDVKDFAKRVEMRPDEIESAAQGLVEGRMKPTEFTGRNNDFRRLAIARAAEIDPKYTPQRYDQVQAVVKRYTSGEDHKTLVNTGTAVNHLLQFKEIAKNTPGNTDVSSWNTFYQNLMKYGDAPEIKSKEAMAGFVAGELVKAASGAQGSMTERVHLEQQLMKANTPAEVTAIVDNSIKLAHGRYSSLKSSYEGSTGRKDFDQIVGMPREAKEAFAKLEGQDAAKAGSYSDAEKEARYQEWKRKQGTK